MFTKNYFFNFIKKLLAEGYTAEGSEQKQILKEAGLLAESQDSFASPTSVSKPSQKDIATELEKLAALKEKGILNDEEFAAQKAKLLGLN